jgi:uncharacterized RDD family membrane protein YckC
MPAAMPPPPPPMPGESLSFPPPGSFVTPSGIPYAGWGIRLGGFLIDGVILYIVQVIIAAVLRHNNTLRVHFTMHPNNGNIRHGSISFLVFIIAAVLFVIYGMVMIGSRGQTVGMMAVGIKATREDGGVVSFGQAFARALVQVVMTYTVIVILLSDLWPLWDPKRQTLHDKAVKTVVIRSRSAG